MNSIGGPTTAYENQPQQQNTPVAEIPAYPVSVDVVPQPPQAEVTYTQQTQEQSTYVPQVQETYTYQPAQVEQIPQPPQPEQQVNLYNKPEQQVVPQSTQPELQTPLEYRTTREGERFFVNPEEGQATFKGGVTTTQLVSKVSGYYTVTQGLVNDPHSGLLQQTAQSGDPTQATTWQATMLYKVLMAFWKALGLA